MTLCGRNTLERRLKGFRARSSMVTGAAPLVALARASSCYSPIIEYNTLSTTDNYILDKDNTVLIALYLMLNRSSSVIFSMTRIGTLEAGCEVNASDVDSDGHCDQWRGSDWLRIICTAISASCMGEIYWLALSRLMATLPMSKTARVAAK